MHGPVAMVTPRTLVLVIALDQKTNENVCQMMRRVRQKDAELTVITNRPEIANLAQHAILLPEECEGIRGAFAAATAIRLFACGGTGRGRGSTPPLRIGECVRIVCGKA